MQQSNNNQDDFDEITSGDGSCGVSSGYDEPMSSDSIHSYEAVPTPMHYVHVKQIVNEEVFHVPCRYQNLKFLGSGGYGLVVYVFVVKKSCVTTFFNPFFLLFQ